MYNTMTFAGNICHDVELKTTNSGKEWVSVTLAGQFGKYDSNKASTFVQVNLYGDLALNFSEHPNAVKGKQWMVIGALDVVQDNEYIKDIDKGNLGNPPLWEKDGQVRSQLRMTVWEIYNVVNGYRKEGNSKPEEEENGIW